MNELVFKQFKVAKDYFIRNVESISKEVASVQPDGFNNTIHWHVGHVLTFTEQLMFGFPKKRLTFQQTISNCLVMVQNQLIGRMRCLA